MKNSFDFSGKRNVDRNESFWSKVDIRSTDECWEWKASKNKKGYGQFWVGTTFIASHRYSYELQNGKINSSKLYVCHKCDNPSCVNPNHLFLGTAQDNETDKVSKGRQAKGNHNGQGGTKNWKNKLSELEVLEIRELHSRGVSYKDLSDLYKVTESMIYYIVSRRSWGWL